MHVSQGTFTRPTGQLRNKLVLPVFPPRLAITINPAYPSLSTISKSENNFSFPLRKQPLYNHFR